MRIVVLIMSTVFVFVFLAGGALSIFNNMIGNELYEDQAHDQLLGIAESKAERVKDFLDSRKVDAVFLAESEDVRNIFDEDLNYDVGLMTAKIKNVAEKTAEEVEDYIVEHPDMTVSDLQESEEFQSIAVQRVGETGWTLVADYEERIVLFHHEPGFIDFDINQFRVLAPQIWEYFEIFLMEGVSSGFSEDFNFQGISINKYQHMTKVNAVTADGARLMVVATTALGEYGGSVQLASSLDLDFKSFEEIKGYSDLIFINPKGDVIWTAEANNELGTNLVSGVYNDSLLANVFNKAKEDLAVGVSDSEAYGVGGRLKIFVTAPVISDVGGELEGVVALELDNEKIGELIETDVGLGDAGEVYIVNRDRRHITSLKFDEIKKVEGSNHSINSERIEACFEDYDNYYFALSGREVDKVEKFGEYLDYADPPNEVLGAHAYILESGWCIIAEMGKDHFLSIIPNLKIIIIFIAVTLFTFLFIISLILDDFLKIKKESIR